MDEGVFRWLTVLLLLAILAVTLMHLARLAAYDKARARRTGVPYGTSRDPHAPDA